MLANRLPLLALGDDVLVELTVANELGHDVVEGVVVQKLVDSHYCRMVHIFENMQLVFHETAKHFVGVNVFLLDDLDSAHDIRGAVKADPDLPEGALAEDAADLVASADVVNFLEAAKILETEYVLVPLLEEALIE